MAIATVVLEGVLNAGFFAAGLDGGLFQGFFYAGSLAAMNVGVAFIIGRFFLPNMNHVNPLRKAAGYLSLVAAFVIMGGLGLMIAHFRDALGQGGDAEGGVIAAAALQALLNSPFGFHDLFSVLLCGLSVVFALGGLFEGYKLTDPYNFIQRQAFSQGLKSLADTVVPQGYLLTVYALGQDFKENAEPVFEKCNPGTAVGMSELDSNPKRAQARYEREFRGPVTQLDNVLMQDKPADKSPIFEMLQLVAINSFRANNVQGPKTLIVYSDMLANTPDFSMFSGLPEFDSFAESPYGQRSQTRLDGVRVELNYLMKYPKLQNRKQLAFWERYFERAGARLVAVTPVEG
ncbi:hypothetical protein D9M68_607950 [compost metagenome]